MALPPVPAFSRRITQCVVALCAWGMLAPVAATEQIVAARYAEPVERYGHFALGQPHEYARLVATTDTGRAVALTLPADEVFEDLAPRMVHATDHAPTELLVIISSRLSGARLGLVGLVGDGGLQIVAQSAPIGIPNRWLNPVGVADLDGDGNAEFAAVTTPHIGGVLRVYRRSGTHLLEIASSAGFSNHRYGSPELDLSKLALIGGRMSLLVPDTRRTEVRVMVLNGQRLIESGRCMPDEPVTSPAALHDCERRLNAGLRLR